MPGEQPPENVRNRQRVGDAFNCGIDEKLFHRYIYSSVNAEEERQVQSHLANCKLCLDEVIAITKVLRQPPTEEEKAAFRKVATLNPEARLEKVMAKLDELCPPETEEDDDKVEVSEINVWERVKIWWEAREPVPGYAYAAAALLVLAIGSFFGIRYYQNTYPIIQAQRELRAHYQTYVNLQNFAESTPRLAGGYAHAAIMVMGEDSASYLEHAHQRVETVLEKDAKSIKARHVLAQIFMMKGSYAQADSVLRQIPVSALHDASLLNDQGSLYLLMSNFAAAEQAFAAAIKADPKLAEAKYNLALTKAKTGAADEANALLQEYVKLEPDRGWREATASILAMASILSIPQDDIERKK